MAQEETIRSARSRGWMLAELSQEDLELFGLAELEERIKGAGGRNRPRPRPARAQARRTGRRRRIFFKPS